MKQKTNITSLPTRDSTKEKDEKSIVSSLSPREIVSELDRYVICLLYTSDAADE